MKSRLQTFFALLFLAAVFILIAVFSQGSADSNANTKIYFLDVGQGDSQYIKMSDGSDILIDGGPDDKVLSKLGEVMSIGDRKIDLIVLTHPHTDHLVGLVEVLNRYEVGEVWESGVEYPSSTYDEWKKIISEKNIKDEYVSAGKEKSFTNGQSNLKVLYPLSNLKNKSFDNINNVSVVTELNDSNFSALFLGDLEKSAQMQILKNLKKIDILKVAHHGAENGMSEELLKITRPAIAIISVGEKRLQPIFHFLNNITFPKRVEICNASTQYF